MSVYRAVAGVLFSLLTLCAMNAHAAPSLHTYVATFSNIEKASGCISPFCAAAPDELQDLVATITVDFDPLFSSGLTAVTSLTFANAYHNSLFGPDFWFRYEATTIPRVMTIGDNCIGDPFLLCDFSLSGGPDLIIRLNFTFANGTFEPTSGGITLRVGEDYRSTSFSVTTGDGNGNGNGDGNGNGTVPEPGTLALLGLGLAGLAVTRRRKP